MGLPHLLWEDKYLSNCIFLKATYQGFYRPVMFLCMGWFKNVFKLEMTNFMVQLIDYFVNKPFLMIILILAYIILTQ